MKPWPPVLRTQEAAIPVDRAPWRHPATGTSSCRTSRAGARGCARVRWLGKTSRNAAALLADRGTDDERAERDEAAEWVKAWFTGNGGEGRAGEIIKAAAKDGIAERTLQRARRRRCHHGQVRLARRLVVAAGPL
jgi:hypothetical protein